ncbi:Caffeic acid 3-O-methyltransferase [Camellia lanceoleosa]|uniref:Caffeic acid 3-O-methyltransferase n=1 Tax=Camellia lanceoleosa TaxID=1840588 RepID=A0ACC0INA2_9ERIC|nr:Caffeic acid 3-O-methyltransferase [Camellia lanceoleosa]
MIVMATENGTIPTMMSSGSWEKRAIESRQKKMKAREEKQQFDGVNGNSGVRDRLTAFGLLFAVDVVVDRDNTRVDPLFSLRCLWEFHFDAGVEHVGADMFESVPKGDAIFMKWILHDWSDNHCLKLLQNSDTAHTAPPDNGKVIVVEGMIPVIPDTGAASKSICQIDLVMMTQIPGGKERTQNEFLALAIGAGFTGISLECFTCNFWVMEFYK